MADGEGTSASRRRQRRLRSWLRNERQTVAMELAAALHHSRDARSNVVHSALLGQKTASSGTRPAPLKEVSEPQGEAATVGNVAGPVPSVARPAMAAPTADGVDAAALSFLVAHSLAQQEKEKVKENERAKVKRNKEEKEERRMKSINEMVRVELPVTHEEREAWRRWIASSSSSSSGKRRKRKKRRKKRLLRAPRPQRSAWLYSGYMFLPRSRRLSGKNSTQLLRGGGEPLVPGTHLFGACHAGGAQEKMVFSGRRLRDISTALCI